jgi:DNA invertase Pin-like site-specific DNA recombinase
MHVRHLAPAQGAPLSLAALPLALEPVPAGLMILVVAVGLVAIGAWLRSALRDAKPPAEPARARPALVPPPADECERPRVIGYVLLEGTDLADATDAIGVWCEAHGWPLAKVVHDVGGARGSRRPGLDHALEELRAQRAAGLVVTRLRDLAESVTELGPLLRWFAESDAFVIALDYELDTSSEPGEFAAGALVAIADWERDRVQGRTRPGLDAARRAVRDDPELSARIAAMRNDGMSLQAIADALNRGGVPTLRGGALWRPSSVQAAAGYRRPSARVGGRG